MRYFRTLIIEDDPLLRELIEQSTKPYGDVLSTDSATQAKILSEKHHFDLVIVDLYLHGQCHGIELLKFFRHKGIESIVLSSETSEQITRQAYQAGCHHFFLKKDIRSLLSDYFEQKQKLPDDNELAVFFQQHFITQDPTLQKNITQLLQWGIKDQSLLIQGPTGVGKGLLAEFIHRQTQPAKAPFIHLNCSEIPENLLESELFGHQKGAFTGADQGREGKLQMAHGGTLFLDEIATMPMAMQQKLLVALETKTFYPLGSKQKQKVNFTLISATCDDLASLIENKSFRADLYYRISGYTLTIAPLMNRPEDINLQLHAFQQSQRRRFIIQEDALDLLRRYHWPGNTRELKHLVTLLAQTSNGIVTSQDLPSKITGPQKQLSLPPTTFLTPTQRDFIFHHGLRAFIEKIEKEVINLVYQKCQGKITEAIRLLKVSNSAFYRMLKHLN